MGCFYAFLMVLPLYILIGLATWLTRDLSFGARLLFVIAAALLWAGGVWAFITWKIKPEDEQRPVALHRRLK